jgi:hypothetical protein
MGWMMNIVFRGKGSISVFSLRSSRFAGVLEHYEDASSQLRFLGAGMLTGRGLERWCGILLD